MFQIIVVHSNADFLKSGHCFLLVIAKRFGSLRGLVERSRNFTLREVCFKQPSISINIYRGKLLEQKNLLDNSLKGKIKKKEIPKWELVVDGLVFYEWEEDLLGRTSNAVIFSESLP